MNEPEHIFASHNRLGETPTWSPGEQALYWVDWGGKPTCRRVPATGEFKTFPSDLPVTAIARRSGGRWIAVAFNGIYAWDPAANE